MEKAIEKFKKGSVKMKKRRKPGWNRKRSCGLCKPWKRVGNSKKFATKRELIEKSKEEKCTAH